MGNWTLWYNLFISQYIQFFFIMFYAAFLCCLLFMAFISVKWSTHKKEENEVYGEGGMWKDPFYTIFIWSGKYQKKSDGVDELRLNVSVFVSYKIHVSMVVGDKGATWCPFWKNKLFPPQSLPPP